jgi:hypothetical protein
MLGVRRASVTSVALELAKAGLVATRRGHVGIIDRKKTARAPCSSRRNDVPEIQKIDYSGGWSRYGQVTEPLLKKVSLVVGIGGTCSTMDTFRITVTPSGNQFVARSTSPALTALGSSPESATENLRVMALTQLGSNSRSPVLIARINQPGLCMIVMQPIEKKFDDAAREEVGWRYKASVTAPAREVAE